MCRQALFELGSKLTHTCGAANTVYQSFGTRGYHVAMTHIAAGDMLTTCYLGPLDAIMPTPMRYVAVLTKVGNRVNRINRYPQRPTWVAVHVEIVEEQGLHALL